jgi:energy-coupling factor transport system permease protein
MHNLAAFTKIILAVLISIASFLTSDLMLLAILLLAEYAAIFFVSKRAAATKALALLFLFSVVLFGIQLLFGSSLELSLLSAQRMAIMANSMVLLLFLTRTQELTAALVRQCHLSYNYAFMVTAIFRFVPDLLAESRCVSEAQACRGYRSSGSPLHRLVGYTLLIKPMVFRAIARSENMAESLDMRGFSEVGKRTFMAETKMQGRDYAVLVLFVAAFIGLLQFM